MEFEYSATILEVLFKKFKHTKMTAQIADVCTEGRTLTERALNEKDRQFTYNVTMRRVCASIVAVEKQWVLHNMCLCICSLRYPACNTHAPYLHIWPVWFYNIFHIISSMARFSKKNVLNTICVFRFSLQLLPETGLILRRHERDMVKIYIGLR